MLSNRDFDLAERRAAEERDEGLRQIQQSLAGPGATHCIHCRDEIPEARRRALPAARTCIDCATDTQARTR